MKKIILFAITTLAISIIHTSEAGVIVFNSDASIYNAQQPITAVFTDANGNTYEQTVYYNPAIGGVDLSNSGAYTSVYFPTLGTAYLWNNGFWVGEDGYYWNNGARVYAGPYWHDHWHSYWGPRRWHNGGYRGGHNDVHINNFYGHENWHGGDWHRHDGGDWHGHDGGDWHGHGGGDWHGHGGGHHR